MALPGTHIRVALELKEKLGVSDLDKYFSGTVYPDSRYVTKLARRMTHDRSYTKQEFYEHDDFKKGWVVHLLYDNIQFETITRLFKNQFNDLEIPIMHGTKDWLTLTAIKTLQDISDVAAFPIEKYLHYLKYIETPNHEAVKEIEDYNFGVIEMYSPSLPTLASDYRPRFQFLGIEPQVIAGLIKRGNELSQDRGVIERINNLFSETIKQINFET